MSASRAPDRWQTFDLRITATRLTVWQNGIVIHRDVELTSGGRGTLALESEGAAARWRAVWFVPDAR